MRTPVFVLNHIITHFYEYFGQPTFVYVCMLPVRVLLQMVILCSSIDTIEVDLCISNPCRNAGTCTNNPEGNGYTCSCVAGYTGPTCIDGEIRLIYYTSLYTVYIDIFLYWKVVFTFVYKYSISP